MQIFNSLGGDSNRSRGRSRRISLKARKSLWKIPALAALAFFALAAALLLYTTARLSAEDSRGAGLLRLPQEEREAAFEAARKAWDAAKFGGSTVVERIAASGGDLSGLAPSPLDPGYIRAAAAAVIDASTGALLFEKNADAAIPPASLAKVAAMYTAFGIMEESGISMSDRAVLPPESWAVNLPPRSSLMFLAQGQRVTMEELFAGMAVASGNDAAIALAFNMTGSQASFAAEMNAVMDALGFRHTRFVEPSGLSEHNSTTAREFAQFCKIYIDEYPDALENFHSLEVFEYPKIWNLPEAAERQAEADSRGITSYTVIQRATNRLLKTLEGCDGLKTGYIDEAGYNFALTCKRGDERFIVVLLGGPNGVPGGGNGTSVRAEDGRRAIEWAFENFRTFRSSSPEAFSVIAWGGKGGYATVMPAQEPVFTIPANIEAEASPRIFLRESFDAPLAQGEVVGKATWLSKGGEELGSVDLIVAERVERGSRLKRAADFLARKCAQAFGKA